MCVCVSLNRYRQDAMDVFLGTYQVQHNEGVAVASPLSNRRPVHARLMPVVLWCALLMLILLMWAINTGDEDPSGETSGSSMVTARFLLEILAVIIAVFIFRFRDAIVDHPALVTGVASIVV